MHIGITPRRKNEIAASAATNFEHGLAGMKPEPLYQAVTAEQASDRSAS